MIGVTITLMINRFDEPFMMYVCDNFLVLVYGDRKGNLG